jgi:hypothetical protein
MAVTYSNAIKSARMTATRDYHANGTLVIQTAADATLVTFTLSASGGTITGASTNEWTLAFVAGTVAASGTGVAAKAVIKNSGGTTGVSGLTVGTSGSDINLDNTSINSGQNVTLSSAKITHAA